MRVFGKCHFVVVFCTTRSSYGRRIACWMVKHVLQISCLFNISKATCCRRLHRRFNHSCRFTPSRRHQNQNARSAFYCFTELFILRTPNQSRTELAVCCRITVELCIAFGRSGAGKVSMDCTQDSHLASLLQVCPQTSFLELFSLTSP